MKKFWQRIITSAEKILMAVVALLFGVLYCEVPPFGDDFWYMQTAASATDAWQATVATFLESLRHLEYDTGRLANLISAPFLCLFPKWVFAAITALLIFYTLKWGSDILGRGRNSLIGYLYIAIYVFVLPWFDHMLSIIFSLNYVWTSFLLVAAIRGFLSLSRRPRPGVKPFVWLCIAAFLTGWMHEGASVPLGAAMAVLILIERDRGTRKRQLIVFASLCAGVIVLAAFPALWSRSTKSAAFRIFSYPVKEMVLSVVAFNCMFYTYLAMMLVTWLRGHLHGEVWRKALFFLVFGVVGTVIYLMFYGGQRVGWFNQLVCGLGTLWLVGVNVNRDPQSRMLDHRYGHKHKHNQWLSSAAKWLISLLIVAHMVAAITVQAQLKNEYDEIVEQIVESPDGLIYYDVAKPRVDLSLFKTTVRSFNERVTLGEASNYFYGEDDRHLLILPSDFKDFNEPNNDEQVFLYKGRYVISRVAPPEGRNSIILETEDGETESRYRVEEFHPSTSPLPLFWIIPHEQTMNPALQITAARWR